MRLRCFSIVGWPAITRTLVLLTLMVPSSAAVWAGTPATLSAPVGPKPPPSGLLLGIDATWVQGNGYRPVKITLTRIGPAVADREILVECYSGAFSGNRGLRTSRYVNLPEGIAQVTETMLVPQTRTWRGMRIDVWEDGRKLEELCREAYFGNSGQPWTEALPKVLIIDTNAPPVGQRTAVSRSGGAGEKGPAHRTLPDIRVLANMLPNGFRATGAGGDRDVLSHIDQLDGFELLSPAENPDSWLGYTCFDLIFISHADMKTMAAEQGVRWQALRSWGMAGGTVCVHDVGGGYQKLGDIERLCGASPLGIDAKSFRGWSVPNRRDFGRKNESLQMAQESQQRNYGTVEPDETAQEKSAGEDGASAATDEMGQPLFVYRSWGLGTLVVYGSTGPFPGTRREWEYLLNSLGDDRWMWYQRHGLSLGRENDDFWNFLIPGVGTAPVGVFRILITLFIVAIGPVNYFLLRRWQRLYLLFVTVPVGAALVVASLFAYALVADGLGSRVRIRSYTHIDQPQRHAVSWSRQSYYAGLAPSRGLVFPTDTAVYPLEQIPRGESPTGWGSRELHWDEHQRLQRGHIASRVTSQFVTVRSRSSNAGLRLTDGTGNNRATSAENQLDANIKLVFLRDDRGNYLRGAEIPIGSKGRLSPSTPQDIRTELLALFSENRPAIPEGFDPSDFRTAMGFMGVTRYGNWGTDYALPRPSVSTGVLEQQFKSLQMFASGPRTSPLAGGSYVAIVSRPSEVPIGIQGAEEVASFHVITGTW